MSNGQTILREDERNFKDFSDWLVPMYKRRGKMIAQIVNVDFPKGELGVGMEEFTVKEGKVVEIVATIEEAPSTTAKKETKKAGTHGASKLTGPSLDFE